MGRLYIYYAGAKSASIEQRFEAIAKSHQGARAGDWSFFNHGFQCLFTFKNKEKIPRFKEEITQKIKDKHLITFG